MKYYLFSLIFLVIIISTTAALGQTSENVSELLEQGSLLTLSEQYEEALPYFEKVLQIEPENVAALKSMGLVLIYTGKYEEASSILDKAIELKPEDLTALNFKMIALGNLGKTLEAGEYLLRISELNQKRDSLVISGVKHFDAKEYDEALLDFESALEVDPNNVDAQHGKGLALFYLEKWLESIKYMQKAVTEHPYDPLVKSNQLAVMYNLPRDNFPDGSLKIQVRDSNGGLVAYYEVLGLGLFQHDKTEDFLKEFEVKKVIQIDGKDRELLQIELNATIVADTILFQAYIASEFNITSVPSILAKHHGTPVLKGDTLTEFWTFFRPVG